MIDHEQTCPECDSAMVLRENRETGDQFWGCSQYPDCRGTRRLDDDSPARQARVDEMPSDRQRRSDKHRWRE